ncbi:TonB-dependent receptor [Haemophilus influenzae]|uniref:Hemoglobin and hemoglobin-haptoglobin-binding protein 1 n=1 Tax=Haemophilus influenzae TaxID=727 RepID=A0ABD6WN94_HAEIF|nr:putative hemoglobin and hemoglobin-haptoglobin-binding protein 1 precursor [Haemophilus influenzae]
MKEKKVGETQISAKKLAKQQASDSRDLVRYETGITVVETGRTGASGYAVRGVDENRVGIMVDGLRQAETLSSQGFKELFEGYGNFNNTRNSIEIENVKTATITKGADSLKSGSGALGGSVIFETKDARDYLIDKDYYLSYKRGYQTMNNQNLKTLTLAGRSKKFDILVVDTKRDGHEIENYDYKIYPNKQADLSAVGPTREKADPYQITRQSTLIKLGFQPNENHRLSVALDDSTLETKGMDLSYVFRPCKDTSCKETHGERIINDQSKRKNIQFSYENFSQTPFWDHIKLSYSSQKITNKARSDEYCHQSTCAGVLNPQGLKLVEKGGTYRIVDKDDEEFKGKYDYGLTLNNSKNKDVSSDVDTGGGSLDSVLINCEKLDCNNKKFRVFVGLDKDGNEVYSYQDRDIIVKTLPNGKKYGEIELKKGETLFSQEEARFLFPKSYGYSTDFVNDRDLNTNTQQIKLDLDKEFHLWHTQHQLKYGGLYEKTLKSMVNHQYNTAANVQWWADYFFCNKRVDGTFPVEHTPAPNYSAYRCSLMNSDIGKDTYLIPVTTKNNVLYFGDNVQLTSWLGLDLNYRYDHVKYLPGYDEKTPVPGGLIAGIFVPFNEKDFVYGSTPPSKEYRDCRYTTPCYQDNVRKNLALLLRKTTYKHHSYNLGLNLDPTNWLRVQLKYANAFRAPTSDEIYMTFKHPDFSIGPNTNLKAETAKTKEVAFTFYKENSYLTLSAFQSDYRNFIDLVFEKNKQIDKGSAIEYPFYQNQNRDRARVRGIEIASRLEMGDLFEKLQGFHLGYKFTYQKGRIKDNKLRSGYAEFLKLNPQYTAIASQDQPMNALQPTTSVYNIGYDAPSQKWGVDMYITDVAAKKAKDSFNSQWTSMVKRQEKQYTETKDIPATKVNGKDVKDSRGLWRNNRYTVIDTIAYWKPIKNLTFTAGVYNLTNKKYLTWDSARSVRHLGTINRVDTKTGKGLNRFYAPGRNYRMSVQFEF